MRLGKNMVVGRKDEVLDELESHGEDERENTDQRQKSTKMTMEKGKDSAAHQEEIDAVREVGNTGWSEVGLKSLKKNSTALGGAC
jgi:hypothetical protein